jgi:drug/metabolite transporter (DMT)-like permease
VATALAAIVLRESVTKWRAAGAVLVVAGIVLLSI